MLISILLEADKKLRYSILKVGPTIVQLIAIKYGSGQFRRMYSSFELIL